MPGRKRDPRTWRELWQLLSTAGRARLAALTLLIALAAATILAGAF
jgi:hypothetical protein